MSQDGGKPAPRWAAIVLLCALVIIAVLALIAAFKDPPAAADPPGPPQLPPHPAPPLEMKPGADPTVRRLRRRLHHARLLLRHERRHTRQLEAVKRSHVTWGGSQLTRDFLCIHRFEGSWTDPNAPYWGGLQMDIPFMKAYGDPFYREWGTADHWPAYIQMAVAVRAYFVRGFEPWPNTSRDCGLK